MKKIIAILLAMAIGLSLAACGSTPAQPSQPATEASSTDAAPAESAPAAEGKAEYAVVLKVLSSQFWQTMRDGIQAEADKMGIKVDIYAANTEDDVEGQVTLLENAISTGYKAIGVAPISDVNLNNAIADATSKGIKIVNIDEKVNMDALAELGGACTAYVATDNVAVGKLGAEYLIEQIGGARRSRHRRGQGRRGFRREPPRRARRPPLKPRASRSLRASRPTGTAPRRMMSPPTTSPRIPTSRRSTAATTPWRWACRRLSRLPARTSRSAGTDGNDDAIQSVADGKLAATVAQDPAAVGAEGPAADGRGR